MALQLLMQSYTVSIKFTGLPGELRVDSSNWDLILDDGTTEGGRRFLNMANADERYQAKSDELNGLLGFEPQNRGFLIRRGPSDYRVRRLTVDGDNMVIENDLGYEGNPLVGLKPTIDSDHTWAGKQTFQEPIEGAGGFKGDLEGDVTGDVTGDLLGNSTGSHKGPVDVTGATLLLDDGEIVLAYLETLIQQRLCPVGSILIWSGAASAIPAGWVLCNGANGTPDLRDRFVMGAGGDQAVGDAGGNTELVSPIAINESGAHTHSAAGTTTGSSTTGITVTLGTRKVDAGGSANGLINAVTLNDPGHTHTLAGVEIATGGAHTHGVTVNQELLLPAFYALCYIMKAA